MSTAETASSFSPLRSSRSVMLTVQKMMEVTINFFLYNTTSAQKQTDGSPAVDECAKLPIKSNSFAIKCKHFTPRVSERISTTFGFFRFYRRRRIYDETQKDAAEIKHRYCHLHTCAHMFWITESCTCTEAFPLKGDTDGRIFPAFLCWAPLFPHCSNMTLSAADGWVSLFSSLRSSALPAAS